LFLAPVPTVGLVITRSITFKKGEYLLPAIDEIKSPVLTIQGDNITVDFSNAVLRGSKTSTLPDQRQGVAILIEAGHNITLENVHIHGYRVAILAQNVEGLHLEHCDWSYNWKPNQSIAVDRNNENDEWIYGSGDGPGFACGGVYLRSCDKFLIENCRASGTKSGLFLSRSNHGKAAGNDFGSLSGIAIGLYRSNDNLFKGNRLGTTLSEQSDHNRF